MSVEHDEPQRSGVDRRDANSPRVRYEALVEVGAGSTGGFEAESVDVSVDGIRLRTAYLPQPGEALVCRFNGYGGEIVAEGQVSWCQQDGRGGEFGVRFTNLDQYGAQLLDAICRPVEDESEEYEGASPGSRVRMHIDGLGSPMRARVRDAAQDEVLIGSNLEFLRVGRDVELEELEGGDKRTAQIEHVGVDIDPETNIPQLVVALRYEGATTKRGAELLQTPVYQAGAVRPKAQARLSRPDGTPEPAVIDADPEAVEAREANGYDPYDHANVGEPYAAGSMPTEHGYAPQGYVSPGYAPATQHVSSEPAPRSVRSSADSDPNTVPRVPVQDEHHDDEAPLTARVRQVAERVGPPLQRMGSGAKSALGAVIQTVRKKRAESARDGGAQVKATGPKRTTAPPPSGALRSDGKRLFREQVERSEERSGVPLTPKTDRKRAVFGAVMGVMSILAIYAVADHLSAQSEGEAAVAAADAQQTEAKASTAQGTAPAVANTPLSKGAPMAAPKGGVPVANVPLFGATPLSTTEPVPPAPGEAAPSELDESEQVEDTADSGQSPERLERDWGVGRVKNPVIMRLKMDGKIAGIQGTESAAGFTVIIPGRKSISSATALARKDKRIDSVNVVNYPDRAEVTFLFKGDIPPFFVKARGKRLVVELGKPSKAKTKAKEGKKKKKKKAVSKRKKSKKKKSRRSKKKRRKTT